MHRFCPALASTVRAVAPRAVAGARVRVHSSPFSLCPTFFPAAVQRSNFAKKSCGKGDAAADSPKAAAGAGSGKAKAGSKSADSESVNSDAAMQGIIAVMK
jgi:hypothetical protein